MNGYLVLYGGIGYLEISAMIDSRMPIDKAIFYDTGMKFGGR